MTGLDVTCRFHSSSAFPALPRSVAPCAGCCDKGPPLPSATPAPTSGEGLLTRPWPLFSLNLMVVSFGGRPLGSFHPPAEWA